MNELATLGDRNYKHFINDGFLPYVGKTECSERWLLFSAIAGIAASLERKAYLMRGSAVTMPNVYIMLIGKSGAKKTFGADNMINLLCKLEDFKMSPNQITPQAVIKELDDKMSQKPLKITASGEEFKMTPYLLYCPEFKDFMNDQAKALNMVEMLTSIYDWSPRPSYKSVTKNNGAFEVLRPCINMLACSTPEWLRESIENLHGGFASRTIFVPDFRPPKEILPSPIAPPDQPLRELKLMHDLNMIYSLVGEFKKTPEALSFFNDWYQTFKPKQLAGMLPGHEFMQRREIQLEKLAMVSSACTRNDLIIDVCHYEEALGWLEPMDKDLHLIELRVTNRFYSITERIYEYVRMRGVTTKGKIQKTFAHEINGRDLTGCLADLASRGDVIVNSDESVSMP